MLELVFSPNTEKVLRKMFGERHALTEHQTEKLMRNESRVVWNKAAHTAGRVSVQVKRSLTCNAYYEQ